jgi:hypothetical protein
VAARVAAAVSSQDEVITGATDSIFVKDDEPCDIGYYSADI